LNAGLRLCESKGERDYRKRESSGADDPEMVKGKLVFQGSREGIRVAVKRFGKAEKKPSGRGKQLGRASATRNRQVKSAPT